MYIPLFFYPVIYHIAVLITITVNDLPKAAVWHKACTDKMTYWTSLKIFVKAFLGRKGVQWWSFGEEISVMEISFYV